MDDEEPAVTNEVKGNASDQKSKIGGPQALGKRKRGISEEEGAHINGLTAAVWGFVDAINLLT